MNVGMYMTKGPMTIPSKSTIGLAAAMMVKHQIRRLPVVDAGRLMGMLAKIDVALAFPPHVNPFVAGANLSSVATTVGEVMSRNLVAVAPETPLDDAAQLMREKKFGGLPVLLGGRSVGIITESDVFRAVFEMLGSGRPGLQVTFDLSEREDAVAVIFDIAKKFQVQVASVLCLTHDDKRVAVVRLLGGEKPGLIDAIWSSGHRVLSVRRDGARVSPATK